MPELTKEEIKRRVTYHPPTPAALERHQAMRESVETTLANVAAFVPESREQSIAITKLEEALFWANAGIARNHDKLT